MASGNSQLSPQGGSHTGRWITVAVVIAAVVAGIVLLSAFGGGGGAAPGY